ncbi:GNAT family N-acetyltransferase [Bradyrhizobium sp. Cp5.3]|uniref:GNAT family N-acetyltransferase n=1 Tax=Bradyrhizobium sp. Cp5.3 TaxID=443598 RepID=UPI0018DD1B84|nr:GNAT family N-acetyltransferase [Bradyrhizobium sp. Cp5.3]
MRRQSHSVVSKRGDRSNDLTSDEGTNLESLSRADYRLVAHLTLDREQEQFAGALDFVFSELRNSSRHELEHPFSVVVAGEIIGFFVLREREALPEWAPSDAVTLHSFRVSREHQGHGYGRSAVRLAAQWLSTNRPCIDRLMLSVNLRNIAARGAYLKWGFRDTGALCSGPIGPQNILEYEIGLR